MRIAMIGQKGIPATFGGVERHVEELSVALVRRGHDVLVYTRPHYTPRRRRTHLGVQLVSLPSLATKHGDAISHTLLATLHAVRQKTDIIHYHGVGPALLSFLPRVLRSSAKVVVTFHSIDRLHRKWGWFAQLMLRLGERAAVTFPHQTIVVSRTLRQYCRDAYGRTTTYIPNGVSRAFARAQKPVAIRRRYGLMADQYILAVSRLIPHKGIHHLIRAYKRLPTKKNLVIVGDAYYTDAYVKELRALAGNDPRILFTGFQKGRVLAELFSNAYLFVLPSESEGLPTALLEAASFGRCVLASNIPENLEIIRSNGSVVGYTFRSKDTEDLTRKLRELLSNPEATKRIGAAAKTVVQQAYDWRVIARSVEQLYTV